MFRPPHHPRTTIHDLPYELLLHIGARFTHLDRNRDLAQLALVSKKWRAVAQEWLLKAPRLNLTYIDKYLWELVHNEHLQPQVKTLEIWSYSEHRIPKNKDGSLRREYVATRAPVSWDPGFIPTCHTVIAATSSRRKAQWKKALTDDCIPALFGVLLCTLPNLRELMLGNAWLMDFPIFWSIRSPYVAASVSIPSEWRHKFLDSALTMILPKLEILDVPADMSQLYFLRTPTVFDFTKFENLKEVGITMRALWWQPSSRRNPPPDPREVFPQTLEVLRISEAGLGDSILRLIQNIRLAKNVGYFPVLRRIEVYFMEALEMEWEPGCGPDPCEEIYRKFCDAGFAMYLYWPAYELKTWEVKATPWTLREERNKFDAAQNGVFKKAMGPFGVEQGWSETVEAEWDVDGDTVM